MPSKSFRKKIIVWLEIVMITSFPILLFTKHGVYHKGDVHTQTCHRWQEEIISEWVLVKRVIWWRYWKNIFWEDIQPCYLNCFFVNFTSSSLRIIDSQFFLFSALGFRFPSQDLGFRDSSPQTVFTFSKLTKLWVKIFRKPTLQFSLRKVAFWCYLYPQQLLEFSREFTLWL